MLPFSFGCLAPQMTSHDQVLGLYQAIRKTAQANCAPLKDQTYVWMLSTC